MKPPGLQLKITLLWVIINILVSGLVGVLLYTTAGQRFRESFFAGKLAEVRTIAASIDGDEHKQFTGPESEKNPEYRRYLAYLHAVKARDPSVTYLYTITADPATADLHYALDSEILNEDNIWVETDYLALRLFWRDGQAVVFYNEDEHAPDFPVEVSSGKTVQLTLQERDGALSLLLGDTEILRILGRSPLAASTVGGPVDTGHRAREFDAVLGGTQQKVYVSFTGAGESTSVPGSEYVDTPANTAKIQALIRDGRDLVETEATQNNYGVSLSAYGVIRDGAGNPAGLVAMDFYRRELEAFQAGLLRSVAMVVAITFVLILAASLLFSEYLLVPLRHIVAAVGSVAGGDLTGRLRLRRRDELGKLAQDFNAMVDGLRRTMDARSAAETELGRLAFYDQTTGLPNRKSFHDRLEETLSVARRSELEKIRGLLFLDLDHFKDVNDTLGHPTGDRVLRLAAERIRSVVRQSDMVFRQGGDEFTVILTALRAETDAATVAEKLVKAFEEPVVLEQNPLHIGLSVGISLFPRDGSTGDELVRSADTALFEAKKDRSAYRFFAEVMQQKASEKMSMVRSLHKGINGDQFALHFQPIMDIQERLAGCEALLRWSNPEMGAVSPGRFIPLAEETGLIIPLGRLGIQVACRLIKRLESVGNSTAFIAVNLSVKQLRYANLVPEVDACLEEFKVDPRRLHLEITESGLMDEPVALERIEEIRKRGILISIDDFGTGYSSLSRLRSLPIDTLKIDRSFVTGTPGDSKNSDLVRAVVTIAHGLGQNVCAEGVETREQLDFLKQVGCDLLRGYLFSPPVPEEAFMEIVRTRPAAP